LPAEPVSYSDDAVDLESSLAPEGLDSLGVQSPGCRHPLWGSSIWSWVAGSAERRGFWGVRGKRGPSSTWKGREPDFVMLISAVLVRPYGLLAKCHPGPV